MLLFFVVVFFFFFFFFFFVRLRCEEPGLKLFGWFCGGSCGTTAERIEELDLVSMAFDK